MMALTQEQKDRLEAVRTRNNQARSGPAEMAVWMKNLVYDMNWLIAGLTILNDRIEKENERARRDSDGKS